MAAVTSSFVLCLFSLSFSYAAKDVFHEELLLRPLKTGQVYAHFQFTTVWDVDIRDAKACKGDKTLVLEFTYYQLKTYLLAPLTRSAISLYSQCDIKG